MTTKKSMNFGQAIEALKSGESVRRADWKEKGLSLFLKKGSIDAQALKLESAPSYPHGSTIEGVDLGLFDMGDAGTTTRIPNINQNTPGANITGWIATQADMLAEDWEVC